MNRLSCEIHNIHAIGNYLLDTNYSIIIIITVKAIPHLFCLEGYHNSFLSFRQEVGYFSDLFFGDLNNYN